MGTPPPHPRAHARTPMHTRTHRVTVGFAFDVAAGRRLLAWLEELSSHDLMLLVLASPPESLVSAVAALGLRRFDRSCRKSTARRSTRWAFSNASITDCGGCGILSSLHRRSGSVRLAHPHEIWNSIGNLSEHFKTQPYSGGDAFPPTARNFPHRHTLRTLADTTIKTPSTQPSCICATDVRMRAAAPLPDQWCC
jgi:hypothetical protein